MTRTYSLLIVFALLFHLKSAAQFASFVELEPKPVSVGTGEKPQSKVWTYDGWFWTVLADNTGTYLWRLDGTVWTSVLKLSDRSTSKADCKPVGEVVHILLFQGTSSELVSVEYAPATRTYQLWSARAAASAIHLESGVETATIEVDGKGRMWLASDGTSRVYARWSDPPYQSWSAPISLASGMSDDDISAVIALPGKIGVLWSDQKRKRFGFRTHADGAPPAEWSANEEPASQSAVDVSSGMADDHLNVVVSRNGTLYAAVKTGYERSDNPLLALLVRRPNGSWDNIYDIARVGTRPIVLLDEPNNKLTVVYTAREGGGSIFYKESPADQIAFGEHFVLMPGTYNNATSTKAPFSGETVILASSSTHAVGVLATTPIIPLPVELVSFTAKLVNGDAALQWVTASEQDNDYFSVEVSTDGRSFRAIGQVPGRGTTQLRNAYAFTDQNIHRHHADDVYYRLKQVDYSGQFEYSAVRHVSATGLEDALAFSAFPSPFADYLHIQISSKEVQPASIVLYNAQGKTIRSRETGLEKGVNHLSLTGLRLAAGVYLLQITTRDQQQVLKVVSE